MSFNPFFDPFKAGFSSDIFRRPRIGGGGRAFKKPEPEAEPEPLADDGTVDDDDGTVDESATNKVVLKLPKWEVDKVGFNEETGISVEAEIPEAEAHKTNSGMTIPSR